MNTLILILAFISISSVVYLVFSGEGRPSLELEKEVEAPLFTEEKNDFRKFLNSLGPVVKKMRMPKFIIEGLARKLLMAGAPFSLIEFLGLKLLSVWFFPIVVAIISGVTPWVFAASIAAGYLMPDIWLNQRVQRRHRDIAKELPNIIDLLILCVGAGMDFMISVNRVARDYKKCPLTQELAQVWRENQMGLPRKDALKNFAWRVNMPEISSFVRTLIQADKMGAPIGDALKVQAEDLRIRRFQQGEAAALKAPVKLLIPLMVFILPVVFIIVAGPVLLQFMRGGFGF